MITTKHVLWLSILILVTLLMRDLPYVNVIIINKIWIFYLILLLLVGLSSIRFKVSLVTYATFALFFIAFILTLLKLSFFAEAIGVLIYFSLWVILIHKMIAFFRE